MQVRARKFGWPSRPLLKNQNICYATRTALLLPRMTKKPTQKVFHLDAVIGDHAISGSVSFSPAPPSGILTELARFEAERILEHMLRGEISAGRL